MGRSVAAVHTLAYPQPARSACAQSAGRGCGYVGNSRASWFCLGPHEGASLAPGMVAGGFVTGRCVGRGLGLGRLSGACGEGGVGDRMAAQVAVAPADLPGPERQGPGRG